MLAAPPPEQTEGSDETAGATAALAPHCASDAAFLAAVIEIQNDIAAVEMDPAMVMKMIVNRTGALCGAEGAAVMLVENNEMVCRAAGGMLAPFVGFRLSLTASLSGQCMKTGAAARCDEPETDPHVDRAACARMGIRSMVVVPLPHHGRVVGVLKITCRRTHAFDDRSIRALKLMAGVLASSLSHALEFEAKRQLLSERADAIAALSAANSRLQESESRFRGACNAAAIGMALVDLQGRWLEVNPALCQILGYLEREIIGTTFQSITHPDDLDADLGLVAQLIERKIENYSLHKRYFHKDGYIVWALLTVSLVCDSEDRPLYFVSQVQDITEAYRRELFEADQRTVLERVAQDRPVEEPLGHLAQSLERQIDGGWASVLVLEDGAIRQINGSLPVAASKALGEHLYRFVAGLAQIRSEATDGVVVTELSGNPTWGKFQETAAANGLAACWACPIRTGDGEPQGFLIVYHRQVRQPGDADCAMLATATRLAAVAVEHHSTTRRLAHLVRRDPLTGLANRLCFEDHLCQAMAAARRNVNMVGLIALDIDHFKQVNDTYGHNAGDLLLQQFAHRIKTQLREVDTFARRGGDEFLLILPGLSNAEGAVAVAQKLIASLREPFTIDGSILPITSSMGISIYPRDGDDSPAIQRRADECLYQAKRRGRNGYAI
jgi:diguanylate cyclase (GGDEF)-like protein/PAS domain S-box-containing protein